MKMLKVGIVYKITYPNGKIYIGQDRTDDINYFGSADAYTIAADFSQEERDDITIRKQVLVRAEGITIPELNQLERKFIELNKSNHPDVGYNRTPGNARKHKRTLFQEGLQ